MPEMKSVRQISFTKEDLTYILRIDDLIGWKEKVTKIKYDEKAERLILRVRKCAKD